MNNPARNEWLENDFLPSVQSYWKRKTTPENPFVFISDSQYNAISKYLTETSRYIQSYTWGDTEVQVKTVISKKGTFYLINFVCIFPEYIRIIAKHFLAKISPSRAPLYHDIFMRILEDCEIDMTEDTTAEELSANKSNEIYEICVDTLLKIKEYNEKYL